MAFSGGLDSTVLLHAVVELRDRPDWKVRAIHIDHQLHPASSDWARHCRCVADKLGIELTVAQVTIARDDAQGIEAAARAARYAVFRRELHDGEVLLTAHHGDDQAETVLLALMRGSGVQGLAAMPAIKEFGRGWHLRPLLEYSRDDLAVWVTEKGLEVLDDPSNALTRHDRNLLRHEVLPQLRKRWPTLSRSIGRSASHLGEALGLLEDLAVQDLRTCRTGPCLSIDALRVIPIERCKNLLRYWLRMRGLPLPSTRKLAGLMRDLFNTDLDRIPCVLWQGAELHWHRGLLYADRQWEPYAETHSFEQEWNWHDAMALPASLGRLSMRPTMDSGLSAARLPAKLTIRFRRGGEKIQLPGRKHRSALRNLLQESDVLPWWRDRLPLVFNERRLLAIGDLFLSDEFVAQPGEAALRPFWEGAPEWKAVPRNDA